MNRKELVTAVAEHADLEQKTVDAVLRSLQSTLESAVAKGDKVSVPGFFALSVGKREAREGRNPATGETIQIAAANTVKFAAGSAGKPDSQLIAWGKEAGITSASFSTCVTANEHKDLVAGVTEAASKRGVNGTPAVFVDGKRVGSAGVTVAQIDSAISAALAKAKSTAAPSPTATPTGTSRAPSSPASSGTPATSPSRSASPSATKSTQ